MQTTLSQGHRTRGVIYEVPEMNRDNISDVADIHKVWKSWERLRLCLCYLFVSFAHHYVLERSF